MTKQRPHKRTFRKTGKTIAAGRGSPNSRTTYEVFVNGEELINFDSKADAEAWVREVSPSHRDFIGAKVEVRPVKSRNYQLGDMYRHDFDYVGMLKAGAVAGVAPGVKTKSQLQLLFNSLEDVNYHEESKHLWNALVELKKPNPVRKTVENELRLFRQVCKTRLGEIAR